MVNYPSSKENLPTDRANGTQTIDNHPQDHNDVNNVANELQDKVGTGASTPTENTVLKGNGVGASTWQATTGSDDKIVSGTEGSNGEMMEWNGDGDAVSSGKTASGSDVNYVTGTAGTSGNSVAYNGDGDLVENQAPNMTSPKISSSINDTNDNEYIEPTATASAVNHIGVTNSATGNDPEITAKGDDTNVGIKVKGKGTGKVQLGDAELSVPDSDGTANQVMQTDGSGNLSFASVLTSVSPSRSDGSDGDVTISSNTTLTEDKHYNNLTINSGITLSTDGYRIFVKGTLTNNGTIENNGGDGVSPTDSTSGGAAGTEAGSNTLPGSAASGAGGDGNQGGNSGSNVNKGLNTNAGTAGADGGGGSGGSGGTVTGTIDHTPRNSENAYYLLDLSGTGSSVSFVRFEVAAGAGGGAGGSNADDGGGGGGGAPGGMVWISANTIQNEGTISANGGNGGDGSDGPGSNTSGGSGGGGGNGGVVFILYGSLTDNGTISATAGSGGSGGSNVGSGSSGNDASAGSDGLVIQIT